jgi:hypothetical protein
MEANTPSQAILDHLRQEAEQALATKVSPRRRDRVSLYALYRGQEAKHLMAVHKVSGDRGLRQRAELGAQIPQKTPYAVEHLDYAAAGHRAGRPEIFPTWHDPMRHPVSGKKENLGGTARGDALSSLDAIPKVLKFLRDSLAVSSPGSVSERK